MTFYYIYIYLVVYNTDRGTKCDILYTYISQAESHYFQLLVFPLYFVFCVFIRGAVFSV